MSDGASRLHGWFAELRRRKVFRVADVREIGKALAMLDRAVGTGRVSAGRGDLGWIEHDPDFDPLRGEARFRQIVNRFREKAGGQAS